MKEINGFEGRYLVDSTGNIHSVRMGIVVYQYTMKIGYKKVNLFKDGKTKSYLVHRLVAQAFIENPNNYKCVNHKNGDKSDNRVENLEWCTHKQNIEHLRKVLNKNVGIKKGAQIYGGTHNKLSYSQVAHIKNMLKDKNKSRKDIAASYNVTIGCIDHIATGRSWKNV